METTQTLNPQTEEDTHVAFQVQNDSCPLAGGDACFINYLPPELLSHIFCSVAEDILKGPCCECRVYSNPPGDEDGCPKAPNRSDATRYFHYALPFPFLVAHVCRYWRNVALSTSSLWTDIVVPSKARPPYECESTLLKQSGSLPIDIHLECYNSSNGEAASDDASLRFLFSLLVPHIHRWRTLNIPVSEYHHMYALLTAISGPSTAALRLMSLRLYHNDWTDDYGHFGYPSMSTHFTLFGGLAPLLTKIVLWRVHVDWSQSWIASASNLKYLELGLHAEDVRPSWAQFSTILRGAPALQKLQLTRTGPSGDPAEWFIEPTPGSHADLNAPIDLARVTYLYLGFISQACAIGLLHRFHLPSLKILSLDLCEDDYTDLVHELARPVTSLSPSQEQPCSLLSKLDALDIIGLSCRIECIELLYGELQNVTELDIAITYIHERFREVLCMPCMLDGMGDVWLPRLKTLFICGTNGDALRKVVCKRRDMGVPLTSVYVYKSSKLEEKDVKWLKENVKTFEFFGT